MKFRRRERERALALLRTSGRLTDVREAEPEPDAAALGANGAISYAWEGNSAIASVYAFSSYHDAREVEDRLREQPDGARRSVATVNGALLLWATADEDDQDGRDVLARLRSAFAGRE
jgi:hypothetical protein